MSRFFDPMAYRFYFICATEEANDSMLINEMRLILNEIEPYILAYAESEPWSMSCDFHLEKASENNPILPWGIRDSASFPLTRRYLETWKEYLKIVTSCDISQISISHLYHMKSDKWYTAASPNQKQLNKIPKLILSIYQSKERTRN